MSFVHNKTKKTYYSIEDKIKHYTEISKGKKQYKGVTKTQARKRLAELKELRARTFNEPELVIVDDKYFGNTGSKPRLVVAIGTKDEHVRVSPFHHRKTNALILDNYTDFQLDQRGAWVKETEIYETKYIDPVYPLTLSDKRKIKLLYSDDLKKKIDKK